MVGDPGDAPPPASRAVVDLVLRNEGPLPGLRRRRSSSACTDILANRFGRYYAAGGTKDLSGEVVVAGKAGHQRRKKAATA